MARWYPLAPCDDAFFTTAPHVYRYTHELAVGPERVWESLTSAHSVADWTPLLKSIEWTSPRPLGIGSTRTVVLPMHALTMHEHFFLWDEGRRFAFYGIEANRPLVQRFAEDYRVEPSGSGARFTWTFALEGTRSTKPLLRVLDRANALAFKKMAGGAPAYFAPPR
jgi:carbon monoxide dehydrogenase subunit G